MIDHGPNESPLQVKLSTREPAFAFMSRVPSAVSISAADLGQDMGHSFQQILEGNTEALSGLARITQVPETTLAAWQSRRAGRSRRSLRGHVFPTKQLLTPTIRGCAKCLREDMERSSLPPHRAMIYRADWLIPHVTVCIRHNQALVPLWTEPKPTRRYDTAAQFREIADTLRDPHPDERFRAPTDFDIWLDKRLTGEATELNWLDTIPLHAAANFCRFLGFALLRLKGLYPKNVRDHDVWACSQMGFYVARRGEDAILDALQKLNAVAEPRQGPKAVFPILYDRLVRDTAGDVNYDVFRSLLPQHLNSSWPLGPGDDLMGASHGASAAFGHDSRTRNGDRPP